LKLGIIGCGLTGRKRAQAIADHSIVVVNDMIAERAISLSEEFGGKVCGTWAEVLSSDVDAVVIAVTHDQLAPISLAAVRAGKHVLVEKPAGRTSAEVQPVMSEAQSRRLVVKCGFNHRFHPAQMKAKDIVESGEIGPLMFIRGRYGHGGRKDYEHEWRCNKTLSGGGELIDQGAHLVDLSRWFLGELNVSYSHMPTYFWNADVEDNCFLALSSDSGQMAWLHASWTEWKNMFCLEIYGRHGKLVVDGLGGSYGPEKLTCYKMSPELGPPDVTVWEYPLEDKSWGLEFQNFVDAVEGRANPIGTIEDAYAMLVITDAAYRARPI